MSTLTRLEALSSEQLTKLETQIAQVKAKRAKARQEFDAYLAEATERMQTLAHAARVSMPVFSPAAAPAPAGNGHTKAPSKPAKARRKAKAKAKQPQIQAVVPVATTAPARVRVKRKARAKRAGIPVAIKYRDPSNLQNTWSGRGKMPTWMAKTGQPKEAFLITQVPSQQHNA